MVWRSTGLLLLLNKDANTNSCGRPRASNSRVSNTTWDTLAPCRLAIRTIRCTQHAAISAAISRNQLQSAPSAAISCIHLQSAPSTEQRIETVVYAGRAKGRWRGGEGWEAPVSELCVGAARKWPNHSQIVSAADSRFSSSGELDSTLRTGWHGHCCCSIASESTNRLVIE